MPTSFGVSVDVGTMFSSTTVAHDVSTKAELLQAKDSTYHVPSHVHYDENGNASVGRIAVNQEAPATAHDNKRFIRQSFNKVEDYIDNYPYRMIEDTESEHVLHELSSKGKAFLLKLLIILSS